MSSLSTKTRKLYNFRQNLNVRRFVTSSLFNETFVLRDIEKEMSHYWNDEEMSGFLEFWSSFCQYAEYFQSLNNKNKFTSEETYHKIILPMLQVLGYGEVGNIGLEPFIKFHPLEVPYSTGEIKQIKIPLAITESVSDKECIVNPTSQKDYFECVREKILVPIVFDYFDSFSDLRINKYDQEKTHEKNF